MSNLGHKNPGNMDKHLEIKMVKEQISEYFKHQPVLKAWLFGSYARNEQGPERYIEGMVQSEFENDSKTLYACIKQLEIIGEAAYHLTPSLKTDHPEVSWKPKSSVYKDFIPFLRLLRSFLWGLVPIQSALCRFPALLPRNC